MFVILDWVYDRVRNIKSHTATDKSGNIPLCKNPQSVSVCKCGWELGMGVQGWLFNHYQTPGYVFEFNDASIFHVLGFSLLLFEVCNSGDVTEIFNRMLNCCIMQETIKLKDKGLMSLPSYTLSFELIDKKDM